MWEVNSKKIYLLMGDLNLDLNSDADKRRQGVEEYITSINATRELDAKVNFPFLDPPHYTNARKNQTYDHIAYIADDDRWPRARHNKLAGELGEDQFDYDMFDITTLFADAGPGRGALNEKNYELYSHDVSDHMPIWLRMAIPSECQQTYSV